MASSGKANRFRIIVGLITVFLSLATTHTFVVTPVLADDTIFYDDLSGSHPGSWYIGHDGGGGSYAWAWPNDYAHEYADPSGDMYYYPDDLHVYMERRGVSLSGYDEATLSFYRIVDTESGWDEFTVNVRDQSGAWHNLFTDSGPTDPLDWSYLEINLDAFAGQSNLYVQFRFDSDGSVSGSPYDGVFIDDVELTARSSNTAPTINLTQPSSNITVDQGDDVLIQWTDSDPDDNAYISLARDTDNDPTNGSGHTWITVSLREDPDGSGDQYYWDTSSVPEGIYYIWGMIYDAVNPEVYDVAPGRVTINPPHSSWLLLYYMSHGGNLECGCQNTFGAIAQEATNPEFQAYVLWDHLTSEDRVYRMKNNSDWNNGYTRNVDYWTATDIGLGSTEIDVGDVNTLNTFIDFVLAREEAEHYALVLFNHGDGIHPTVPGPEDWPIITGISFDDGTTSGPYLSIEELGQGSAHLASTIGRKFEILHLNACLMQMIEINHEVRNHCDYVIASENEGWVCGSVGEWETSYLHDITNSTSVASLANAIGTSWFNAMAPFGATVSVLRTEYTDEVTNAVDDLAQALINNMRTIRGDLQSARNDTQKFALFDGDNTMTDANIFLDLEDLCQEVNDHVTNSEVNSTANVVISAIGDEGGNFVRWEAHQNSSGATPSTGYYFSAGTYGVSIFYPDSTSPNPPWEPNPYYNYVNDSAAPSNLAFCSSTQWDEFLRAYLEWKVLKVSSSGADNVDITCTTDELGHGNGRTTFTRLYQSGASVSLTAPASAGGLDFVHWNRNGSIYSTDRSISFSMNSDYDFEAVYGSADVGPLVYDSHTIDDDNSGNSNGNDNGIVNCGETIELDVDLYNQGSNTATGVDATISTSDYYVSVTDDDCSYPDIPGGDTATSNLDFDFEVDPSTPDGHVIHFDLDITASNGGPWSDSFDVPVVCVNTPPTLSGLPDRTLDEDTSLDNTIDLWAYASDGETPDSGLTYTIDNVPAAGAGVTIDSNRYIDVNPVANWCGWTDVRIRVADPGGLWDTDTFRVTVTCVNDLPWISPTVPNQSEAQDQPITIDLTAYEHDVEDSGTSLDWYVTDEFNCTVSGEYSDNDVLIFTPEPDFVGSETVTLHLVDSGGGEATQDVTLTWSSSGTPPTLSGLPDRTLDEDASLDNTIDLWAHASDNETHVSGLTYTIDNSPNPDAGVAVDPDDYIDINPTANWCGWTDVRIRVTDPGGLWDTDTFRVTVNCINDLPWISPTVPDQSEAQDQPITIDLTAYEHDVEDSGTSLDWHVTGEDNCTVTGEYSDDDVLTFIPDGGFVASDTVTLHLVDSGGGEATQDITLTWSSSGTPPTLSGLPDRTLDEDASLDNTIDLWAYASDGETPDSGLTYTIDNVPAAGAGVTIDSNRYIDVNPVADWCGWTDVTIRVTDPGGLWDTDTFRVTVNCVNDPPNTPSAPNPADGATDVSITTDLSWMGGDPDAGDTVTYDAYFEANDSTPGNLICDGVSPPLVCDPGTLAYDTHYYWYVIATDNHGASTTGDTWDFYTVIEPPVCEPILQVFEPQVSGDHVTINGVVTPQPGCPAIARIHWNWGDGQEHDSWFAAEHTYGALGTYLVTVTAYDLEGHTAVQTTQVDIVTLPVELYYDDGQVDAAWATGPLGGAAVLFTPPEVPWLLSEIKVAGWYARSDAPFYVEIWDSGRNELLHESYTYSQFFGYETLTWAEIDIPDVVVDGDFYVCVFPNDLEDHILWLGFDNDPPISYRSYDVRYDTNSVEYGPHDDWDWTIRATGVALPPPAPSLSAPPNGSSTCDTIPTFSWGNVSGATSYRIQVDNNSDFSSPEINRITSSTSYTPGSSLSPDTYRWRVRASNSCGNGSWSSAWSVTILSTPAAVSLSSPSNGASIGDNPPTFSWGSVSGATSYRIQVADNSGFSSPEIDQTTSSTSYTPGSALLLNGAIYYWRVRASNTCGSGSWSAKWEFTTPAPSPSEFWIYLPILVKDYP